MSDKAFLVDTTKCSGCRSCQVACKQWNENPGEKTEFFAGPELTNPKELSAITWNHVKFFPLDRSNPEKPSWTIMHKKCYHCETPNCLRVCPEKAISKVDGWVVIDQDKCIGCGACVNECIYKVPGVAAVDYSAAYVPNPGVRENKWYERIQKGKSHKCHACTRNERTVPACAFACPTGALTYDHRLRVIRTAQERLAAVKKDFPKASIYGLKEFDGLRVITILKDAPEKFGLPINPTPINITKVEEINNLYSFFSLFTFGLPFLKRTAYKVARSMTVGDRGLS